MKNVLFPFVLSLWLLPALAARAQTSQPGQGAAPPTAEPPIKAVPLAGHQAKPLRVDEHGPIDATPGPRRNGRPRHADRPRHGGHGPGGGHGHRRLF